MKEMLAPDIIFKQVFADTSPEPLETPGVFELPFPLPIDPTVGIVPGDDGGDTDGTGTDDDDRDDIEPEDDNEPRTADNLAGGPLEGATRVSGRFALDGGPANGTVYRADNQGNITSYATYDSVGNILTRVDVSGAAHNGVPTPHVIEYGRNTLPDGSIRVHTPSGDPRPAR